MEQCYGHCPPSSLSVISGAGNTLLTWIALGPGCIQRGLFVEGDEHCGSITA